jgi:hypothetical protein
MVKVAPTPEQAPLLENETGNPESLLAATVNAVAWIHVGGACTVTVIVWGVPAVAAPAPPAGAPAPTIKPAPSNAAATRFVLSILMKVASNVRSRRSG